MKLVIISHTEHYEQPDGTILGWGPTVREINHLLEIFEEIYHLAMISKENPPKSALQYKSKNIHFVPIPSVGGRTFKSKASIVLEAPTTIKIVNKILKKVDCFQFRAPTGIGIYLIPYLTLFSNKKGWYKYAGNWNQSNAPIGYSLQRLFLKYQKRKVTINGRWPNQPKHCLTFENPCLDNNNINDGIGVREYKKFETPFNFCFVGRIEEQKGVDLILDTLHKMPTHIKRNISVFRFLGNGKDLPQYKKRSMKISLNTIFMGSCSNEEVFEVLKNSHFLLLPSKASEGFPKVIAEALNYGCIPIVSNISSISQYIINRKNGFVIETLSLESLQSALGDILVKSQEDLQMMYVNLNGILEKFTFQYYNRRIQAELLNE